MDSGMKVTPRHPNIFEFTYDYLKKKLGRKDINSVECVNNQNLRVPPLEPTKPLLRFNNLQNKLVGLIFLVAVLLVDTKYLPWLYKIWVVSFAALVYLVKCDLDRIPVRYVHPLKAAAAEQKQQQQQQAVTTTEAASAQATLPIATTEVQNGHTALLEEEQGIKELISVSQCEFHILQVKVVDHHDGITNPALQSPAKGSKAVFQITVICGRNRWEVWRKYEHFCRVYDTLCTKYASHKIARLPSLDRLKKTWRNLAAGPGDAATSPRDGATAEEEAQDDAIFLGHAFLQKLQAEMLAWLRTMQQDPISDDPTLRALLKLPPHKSGQANGVSGAGASAASDAPQTGPAVPKVGPAVVKAPVAAVAAVNAGAKAVPTSTSQVTAGTESAAGVAPTAAAAATIAAVAAVAAGVGNAVTAVVDGTALPAEDPTKYVSPCGNWKGRTVDSFQWLDLTPEAKDMYIDIKYTHDFKVRGKTYISNKKKVGAGPGIAKIALMENIHVDTAKYGERLDHIAAIGRVKRRVEIMTSLPGNPFVIILNLQIPGDPPCSIVFYFLIPLSFYPGTSDTDGLNGARELFRKFIDIPLSEVITESEEFLAEQMQSVGGASGHAQTVVGASAAPAQRGLGRSATSVGDAGSAGKTGKTKSAFFAKQIPKSWTSDVSWPDMSQPQPGVLPRDSFQNKRFKLIPAMVEAPWVVQMAVSSTPVLLGQKVVQRYWRGEHYMEIDVHVGSSSIADNIVGVCRSYSKAFICNLGIVIQGESEEELPEEVLACAALKYIDVERHSPLESYPF